MCGNPCRQRKARAEESLESNIRGQRGVPSETVVLELRDPLDCLAGDRGRRRKGSRSPLPGAEHRIGKEPMLELS